MSPVSPTLDLYALLGVTPQADARALKSAYRRQARQHHPDLNPRDAQAHARFVQITAAFEILSDPSRRARYDEFGLAGLEEGFDEAAARAAASSKPSSTPYAKPAAGPAQASGQADAWSVDQVDGSGLDPFAPVFDHLRDEDPFVHSVFGERPVAQSARGADLRRVLEVPLELSVTGGAMTIQAGSPAPAQALVVRVPAGVEDGEELVIAGHGERPLVRGGQPGDLRLLVKLSPHAWLRRVGLELEAELSLTLPELLLGARVAVRSPHGERTVVVPAGTTPGARLRLAGQGVRRGERVGDLWLITRLVLPQGELDERARQALQTLAQAYAPDELSRLPGARARG